MITPYQVMYYGFDLNIIRFKLGREGFKNFKKKYDHMIDEIGFDCLELDQEMDGIIGVTIH